MIVTRYACGVEYDGSGYHGFQLQSNGVTVQELLEKAIAQVANHPLKTVCAGRTDTGVSAACQVVHFDSQSLRTERQWLLGINSALPRDIVLLWVRKVPSDFHARFSAVSRSYEYSILNRNIRPALMRHVMAWQLQPLDHKSMDQACQYLLGTHDFNALRSTQCQSKQPTRTVKQIGVERNEDVITMNVTADGFLHHMVRNIMGCLIPIGLGEKPIEWMQEVLISKDRKKAGVTASPHGLVFKGVEYPAEYGIKI